ncbi:class II glutamine amidotransferase [Dactylosporangium matsuzakiense]|uniref:Class II glutamine amidotransferase n=1 Tax=Dactylosporangium matsuzakiense TaxID=53360 RepID=A0A9W6KQ59_9ACTN|nr:class II glutamine amidotransferase [Dactylosporangium matsuzakiense]UWZ41904.1 class II glutamine amidotransferase [Dactylosporangium matsuzakiense]GLL04431.1 class II glutamine amidotransferase [Dactylosporangium matsuzakiense]
MCRWLAYSGSPILLAELLYKPEHSLIDQSMHARLGVGTTNGDGFGVGWYTPGGNPEPTLFRGTGPAWGDENLRELAYSVRSGLFLAHIRASTGTPVQQTNCHPFRHGRWLWLHNGRIRDYPRLKRTLTMAVDPGLFPYIGGSTDSELMFYLALTFGLERDPVGAVERMVGWVEHAGRRAGIDNPVQMTVATSDGERLWAFRYSTERNSRSLYCSTAVDTLRCMYPENPVLQRVADSTRIVVSEPLGGLVGAWQPVAESSYGLVTHDFDVVGPFRPAPHPDPAAPTPALADLTRL